MELMIAIAVFGILAAIAAPSINSYIISRRVNGAARQIMSELMEARMKAATENNRFKIFFLDDNHSYKTLDDTNNNNSEDSGETSSTRDIQSNYPGVTLSSTTDPIFYPNGTAYGTTVTITNSSGYRTVSVSTAGRVKID